MVGLIVLTLLVILPVPLQQDPALEPHRQRVVALLESAQTADLAWRKTLFQSITRLEHAPVEEILPAWEILATSGGDSDQGNLVLFQRRRGLPLAARGVDEGVDALLERALAAWGEGRRAEAAALLDSCLLRAPEDDRAPSNLAWLERKSPQVLNSRCDARAAAHAVLAARGALP